ncbi:MAG: lipopolysaccharide transport system permease protein [Frankiaceae bacterium]|nr:lipopolysaccharide transport system permease protein [Frankiaceae bacterium]
MTPTQASAGALDAGAEVLPREDFVVTTSTEPVAKRPARQRDHAAGFELSGPGTPLPALLSTLWRTRQVLFVLARKDFFARYRRTSLGLFWALGLPLIQAVVLTVVFTHVVRVGRVVQSVQGGHHFSYAVFIYSGIVGWSFFSTNMPGSATSVVDGSGLAGKIYFPRLMLPLLVVVTGLYPLIISLGVLFLLTLALQHSVGFEFLFVIPATVLVVGISAAFGIALSALHVYFRDVKFLVQAVMSVLFYATPIIYSLSNAPASIRPFISFGPMAGPIELFRMATVGADSAWPQAVAGGVVWFTVAMALGLYLHSRFDRVFVDRL